MNHKIPSYENRPPEDGALSETEYLSIIEGGYKPRIIFSQRRSSMTDQEMRDYAIERLVLAERERCAKRLETTAESGWDDHTLNAGQKLILLSEAAAIRSGK